MGTSKKDPSKKKPKKPVPGKGSPERIDTGKVNPGKLASPKIIPEEIDPGTVDIEKNKTLEQVQDAIEIVESARADLSLNSSEKNKLELASINLRKLERSLIKKLQAELVASLTADSKALQELSIQIKESSDKLSGVAATIEKAATVVESFIKIATAVVGLGLI